MPVSVEVLGHLVFYLPPESRKGAAAKSSVPPGTRLGNLADMLGIPPADIQSFVVNGETVFDPSYVLASGDTVVILPVISGG
jgi:molybdopterin converting factor small subunit